MDQNILSLQPPLTWSEARDKFTAEYAEMDLAPNLVDTSQPFFVYNLIQSLNSDYLRRVGEKHENLAQITFSELRQLLLHIDRVNSRLSTQKGKAVKSSSSLDRLPSDKKKKSAK